MHVEVYTHVRGDKLIRLYSSVKSSQVHVHVHYYLSSHTVAVFTFYFLKHCHKVSRLSLFYLAISLALKIGVNHLQNKLLIIVTYGQITLF